MLFRLPSLLLLLLLLAAQQAVCSFNSSRSHHRGRVLALLPHPSQRFSRFSHLFSSIEARGYDVVARGADDPGLRLREWDSWLWDKVVVIPEEKGEDEVRGGGEREKGEREEKRDEGIDVAIVFSAIECLRRERARGKTSTSSSRWNTSPSPRRHRDARRAASLDLTVDATCPRNPRRTKKRKSNQTLAALSTRARSSSSSRRAATSSSRSLPNPRPTSAPWPRPWARTRSRRGATC